MSGYGLGGVLGEGVALPVESVHTLAGVSGHGGYLPGSTVVRIWTETIGNAMYNNIPAAFNQLP